MGHAIGFNHEQTRPNRDGYVYIRRENIQQGLEYNFMKYSPSQQNDYDVPYDYSSVMHYSQYVSIRITSVTWLKRKSVQTMPLVSNGVPNSVDRTAINRKSAL